MTRSAISTQGTGELFSSPFCSFFSGGWRERWKPILAAVRRPRTRERDQSCNPPLSTRRTAQPNLRVSMENKPTNTTPDAADRHILKLVDEAQNRGPQETVQLLRRQSTPVISKVLALLNPAAALKVLLRFHGDRRQDIISAASKA